MIVSEVCKEMFTSSNKSTVKNYEAVGTNGEQASRTDSHNRLRQARLSLVMCGTVALVMQLCPGGTAAVQFSGPILGGFAPELRNVIALLCNMVALPGSVLAFFLVDCAGRLKLLLVSALGQAAAAFGLAYVFYQQSLSADQDSTSSSSEDGSDNGSVHAAILGFAPLDMLAFVSLGGAQFSYTLGWGTVAGVLMSELMPAGVRGLGLALAQSVRSPISCHVHADRPVPVFGITGYTTSAFHVGFRLMRAQFARRVDWQIPRCQQSSSQLQNATALPQCLRLLERISWL